MKNNILFLITKSEIGGAQRFVQEQMQVLADNGYKSSLVTNKPGWLDTNAVTKDASFHMGIESKLSIGFLIFLCRYIKKNQVALVVCNSANGGLYGRIAAYFMGCRSVYVSHGWSSVYNGGKLQLLFNFIEKILGSLSDGVLCISENDYKVALTKIGLKKEKLFLMPNSIFPLPKLSPILPTNVLKVLMVCRLDHPKRPDLLIEAIKGNVHVQLTIVGDGPMMDKLRVLTGASENITLKGEVLGFEDFEKFDAFALISESEGLPISALEAMSAGLALILSNVGGCPSLVQYNGVLVENNKASIQKGLTNVAENLAAYKIASKSLFDERHNLIVNTPKYMNYYLSKIR